KIKKTVPYRPSSRCRCGHPLRMQIERDSAVCWRCALNLWRFETHARRTPAPGSMARVMRAEERRREIVAAARCATAPPEQSGLAARRPALELLFRNLDVLLFGLFGMALSYLAIYLLSRYGGAW
ncbi:MAG: hypothetical protein KY468_12315, partial [Armatimonadetes bacterium]|nr:hypothetical protein [Armatimonadota bacterium]